MKFDDLYNALVNEAPMSSFLSRLGKGVAAATPGVARGTAELAKGVGGVIGTAAKNVGKTVFGTPGAVKAAREFMIGQGGQPRFGDDPAGAIKNRIDKIGSKEKKEGEPDVEEFDKNTVKALIAGQSASGQSSTSIKPAITGSTTSGTVQGSGQVTQGQAITGGLPGSTPAQTSTTATTSPTTINQTATNAARLMGRDPKAGDVFTLPSKFGRIERYRIKNVGKDVIGATKITA